MLRLTTQRSSYYKIYFRTFIEYSIRNFKISSIFFLTENKVETIVKKEAVNYTEWYLVAVSEAARKYRNLIRLKSGENKIGRSRKNDICLNSGLCSKSQCILCVNEVDVILKDNVSFSLNPSLNFHNVFHIENNLNLFLRIIRGNEM